jgi:hypothetical protein
MESYLERLNGACYLSRGDHDWKIWGRTQRKDIGKYSFVHRTIKLWNQPPAEVLQTFPCKPHSFRKRVRSVFVSKGNLSG